MSDREFRVLEVDEMGIGDETVCDFIARHWKRRVAISLPDFHAWQFRQGPANAGRNRCLVVVDERDRVWGFMGVNEREVRLRGRTRRGAELTTWVIAEELRGSGLGKTILQNLQRSYEVILGLGISDAALALYMRFGFKYIRYLPRYVRIFDPDAIEPISDLTPLGKRLIREPRPVEQVSHRSRRIEAFEAAEFAKPLHESFNCGGRDAPHLEWRYSRHPVYRYDAFRISHGSGDAAVILRIDEKGSLRIVHVLDFLGDARSVPAAISFLETFCRDVDADMSDFYCTQTGIGHLFWHQGWLSAVDDFYIQVPNWFYPIDMRAPPTTSIIMWAKHDMDALIDQSKLYMTKGDCDADRPTIAYLEEKGISA